MAARPVMPDARSSSNPFLADLDSATQRKLLGEADLELARRSVAAALMYPALFTVVTIAIAREGRWSSFVILGAVLLVLGLGRVWLSRAMQSSYEGNPPMWARRFRFGVYASALVWSIFAAAAIATRTPGAETFVILLVTTGITSGGTITLAPDLKLARRYQVLLLAPSALALCSPTQQSWSSAAITLVYLLFLYLEARQHWNSYWRALKANALLTLQSEELKRAKEAAETATRVKGEFLANVSHELRTPLNGILGMSELTLETEVTEEQREYLKTVVSCGESLLAIISDLLDLSSAEAQSLELRISDFDLREAFQAALVPLEERAQAKGLEFSSGIDPELPEVLVGDWSRLRQVLDHIVSNAIKFTPSGAISVEVRKETDSDTHLTVEFTVKDTGIGIPPDKQAGIFDPFSQADGSLTRRYGGTGLGLTLASRLTKLMGGRIWLESEPNRGSVFHFTVRLKKDRRKRSVGERVRS